MGISDIEKRARRFAANRHAASEQVRKYTGEPYITHPAAVTEIVRSVSHTAEMLAAAWLHDTVEDTNTTHEEIRRSFGSVVAEYVYYLSDLSRPGDGNRKAREAIDRNHIAQAPAQAKTIKLADLIHNSESILKDGDTILWEKAMSIYDEYRNPLNHRVS